MAGPLQGMYASSFQLSFTAAFSAKRNSRHLSVHKPCLLICCPSSDGLKPVRETFKSGSLSSPACPHRSAALKCSEYITRVL
eukprot:5643785-Pleurochrysis_carterae.AAC.1